MVLWLCGYVMRTGPEKILVEFSHSTERNILDSAASSFVLPLMSKILPEITFVVDVST